LRYSDNRVMTLPITLGDAVQGRLLKPVIGDRVAEAIAAELRETLHHPRQKARRQGDQHFIILHAAELTLGIARDGDAGLASGEGLAPTVGAGAFTHTGEVIFFVAGVLKPVDESKQMSGLSKRPEIKGEVAIASYSP